MADQCARVELFLKTEPVAEPWFSPRYKAMGEFVTSAAGRGMRVALVTSGGTVSPPSLLIPASSHAHPTHRAQLTLLTHSLTHVRTEHRHTCTHILSHFDSHDTSAALRAAVAVTHRNTHTTPPRCALHRPCPSRKTPCDSWTTSPPAHEARAPQRRFWTKGTPSYSCTATQAFALSCASSQRCTSWQTC